MTGRTFTHLFIQASFVTLTACGSPAPEELLSAAQQSLSAGEVRTAEIHLKNLLREEPGNLQARILLGEVFLAGGNPTAAEQTLRRVLDLGAAPADVHLLLLRSLLEQGRFDDVLELVESGPALEGDDRVTMLRLEGAAHHAQHSWDKAESAYEAALDLDPNAQLVRTELAATFFEARRVPEAEELVSAVLSDDPEFVPALLLSGALDYEAARYEAAEASFRHALQLEHSASPHYSEALIRLIETQLIQNDLEGARINSDSLLALNRRNPAARYLEARTQLAEGDLQGAEHSLESLIAESPEYWPAYRLLGGVNASQDQIGQAMMYLRVAVNNQPDDRVARLLLAELYVREGEIEDAKKLLASSDPIQPVTLQQLASASSTYVAVSEPESAMRLLEAASFEESGNEQIRQYLLAMAQLRQGDLVSARATADRLILERPDSAWPLNLRGTIAALSGDMERVREYYTRALEADPRDVVALFNLAWIYSDRGDDRRALELAARAYDADPGNPAIADTLGWLKVQSGDAAGGLPLLARAAAGLPDNPEIQFHWAVALAETNESQRALNLLNDLLANGEDFPSRSEAQQYLIQLQNSGGL